MQLLLSSHCHCQALGGPFSKSIVLFLLHLGISIPSHDHQEDASSWQYFDWESWCEGGHAVNDCYCAWGDGNVILEGLGSRSINTRLRTCIRSHPPECAQYNPHPAPGRGPITDPSNQFPHWIPIPIIKPNGDHILYPSAYKLHHHGDIRS